MTLMYDKIVSTVEILFIFQCKNHYSFSPNMMMKPQSQSHTITHAIFHIILLTVQVKRYHIPTASHNSKIQLPNV